MRVPSSPSLAPRGTQITLALGRFDDLLAVGLRQLIAGDPSLVISAQDVEHARLAVVLRAHDPDVAIIDVRGFANPAEIRELAAEHPSTRLVLLAEGLSGVECAQLLAFGASACLARDTQARDMLNAIHLAARGLQVAARPSTPSDRALGAGSLLTRREAEVLPLLAQGRSNAQIALALQVGVETVRTHARNIYRKFGVSSRRELAASPVPERQAPAQPQQPSPRLRPAPRRPRVRRGHDARHI